jgi:putative membrane protein insertion efficiency factor
MIKLLFIKIIELYQKTISPDHGIWKANHPSGYCKYSPTCSEYCKQSIIKHGVILGGIKGLWRILRCNPWSKGGYDPV